MSNNVTYENNEELGYNIYIEYDKEKGDKIIDILKNIKQFLLSKNKRIILIKGDENNEYNFIAPDCIFYLNGQIYSNSYFPFRKI